ncbi:CBS-domain-containing protein [Pisolithus croceorrhizus]|nr:CBS-domain-containing protein [Pisolithus croceorrhizus]
MSASNLSALSDTRKKQSKRDEAIRKKIESELARKRTISSTHLTGTRSRRTAKPAVAKGTVAALKPSPALTVPENITVAEASQLCAAKRTDCVLVVDDEEGLSGIFTAKDLAYRVTADGLDPHHTPVSHIMTRGPMVTRDTTSATEALQLMVQRHFRHLPVCNEEGNVVGLLDITKVFHEALDKVERSSSASEKLYNALAGVQSELGPGVTSNPQAAAMLAYVDALREKTALPDLSTVMDSRTQPAVVSPKTTVRDVAKLMKERRVTAVCVMENTPAPDSVHPKIVGIFTSKDVVLRVIAAGLDANICSVIRVMTPHPDTAPPTMSVHDALKKMHNGHYLNLPVVEADGRLVAIVDVLKLTYATLEQMNAMTTDAPGDTEGGPMWGRFFDSIGGHEDTESMLSGSHHHTDAHSLSTRNVSFLQQSPNSEVHPNDSASVVDDDQESALEGYPRKKSNRDIPAITGIASSVPVDDGTYVFKFRTPSGRTHRFQARHDSVETLREIVCGKLSTDPFFTEFSGNPEDKPDPTDFTLSYTDADGDMVLITSDSDIADAVKIARTGGSDRVVLVIEGGKHWTDAGADKSEDKAKAVAEAAQEQLKALDRAESTPEPAPAPIPPPPPKAVLPLDQELVMGIPKDLLLPASIGALAVVILGVFTISRLTRD